MCVCVSVRVCVWSCVRLIICVCACVHVILPTWSRLLLIRAQSRFELSTLPLTTAHTSSLIPDWADTPRVFRQSVQGTQGMEIGLGIAVPSGTRSFCWVFGVSRDVSEALFFFLCLPACSRIFDVRVSYIVVELSLHNFSCCLPRTSYRCGACSCVSSTG